MIINTEKNLKVSALTHFLLLIFSLYACAYARVHSHALPHTHYGVLSKSITQDENIQINKNLYKNPSFSVIRFFLFSNRAIFRLIIKVNYFHEFIYTKCIWRYTIIRAKLSRYKSRISHSWILSRNLQYVVKSHYIMLLLIKFRATYWI